MGSLRISIRRPTLWPKYRLALAEISAAFSWKV
jgi:hypothetical protein